MAGQSPKDAKDVKLEEYELLADGWFDPADKTRYVKGDTVKVESEHAAVLIRLGSLGKKGIVKASEEEAKATAEKVELHQKIHMGMVDPAESDKDDKGNKVNVRPSTK